MFLTQVQWGLCTTIISFPFSCDCTSSLLWEALLPSSWSRSRGPYPLASGSLKTHSGPVRKLSPGALGLALRRTHDQAQAQSSL